MKPTPLSPINQLEFIRACHEYAEKQRREANALMSLCEQMEARMLPEEERQLRGAT